MGRPRKVAAPEISVTSVEFTDATKPIECFPSVLTFEDPRKITSVRFHQAVPISSGYEMVHGVQNGTMIGREKVDVHFDIDSRFIMIRTGKQEVLCPMTNVAAIHLEISNELG